MPKKYIILIKKFRQHIITIIFLTIALIALLFINVNPVATIWICVITILLLAFSFLVSYINSLFFTKKLNKTLKSHYKIDDRMVARKLKEPLKKIQEKMYDLTQYQSNKEWLIIFLERHYIYYHKEVIVKFNELYSMGSNEKEILEGLKDFDIETRAEIKSIRETLIKHNRINQRKKAE
ncbi:MAG: hypothetical protein ACFFBP_21005 [Promethearchaeota archaeon]